MLLKLLSTVLLSIILPSFGLCPDIGFRAMERSAKTVGQNEEHVEYEALLVGEDGTTYSVDIFVSDTFSPQVRTGQLKKEIVIDLSPENMQLLSVGNQYESLWDSSGGIQAYSTIYYDKKSSGHILVSRASGGWINKDPYGSGIKDCGVFVSCTGPGIDGYAVNQSKSYTVNGTYNLYPGFGKYADPISGFISVTSITTIYRVQSGSSWTLLLTNRLY